MLPKKVSEGILLLIRITALEWLRIGREAFRARVILKALLLSMGDRGYHFLALH